MKTNPNDSAFSLPITDKQLEKAGLEATKNLNPNGLTKREYFAAMAMQSILINPPHGHIDGVKDYEEITGLSCKYADALITELNK